MCSAIRAPGCRRNAYVLIYVAKEIKNVGPESTTHAFTKDHGVWKLSLSRTSLPKEE